MYEHLKNELITNLIENNFEVEQVNIVINCLNKISYDYDITKKKTEIVILNTEMPKLLKTYLICKKMEGYSEGTLYNIGKIVHSFFYSVNKTPEQITANDIRYFLYKYKESKNIKDCTLDKYRQYICSFYEWVYSEGYIKTNPAYTVKPIKYEKETRNALKQIELEYLRKSCKTEKEKAIVEVLYSTGCRVSELCGIKFSDIDYNNKTILVFGKGKKYRTVMLNAKSIVALEDYLKVRNGNEEFLFVSDRYPYKPLHPCGIQKILRNVCSRNENLNVKVTPHILRHTTATTARKNGMPIENISKMLGHENINTTLIYAKSDMEEIRMEHEKYVV